MGHLLTSTGYYTIFQAKFLPFEENAINRICNAFERKMNSCKEFQGYSWTKNKGMNGLVIHVHSPKSIETDIYQKSKALKRFVNLLNSKLTFKPKVMFFDEKNNNCINLDYFSN